MPIILITIMVGDVIAKGSRLTKQGIVEVEEIPKSETPFTETSEHRGVGTTSIVPYCHTCHARNGSIVQ